MGLAVRDAIDLGYLDGCTLLAGKNGLDREIEVVSVIEVPDACSWARGGELGVTAFFGLRDKPERQVELIEALARKAGAGIVIFYTGMYLNSISAELIGKAEEMNLPLFEARDTEMTYGDLIKPIMEELAMRKFAVSIMEAADGIDIATDLGDYVSVTKLLSTRLGLAVVLVDSAFHRLEEHVPPGGVEADAGLLEECRRKYESREYSAMDGIARIEMDTGEVVLVAQVTGPPRQSSRYVLITCKPGNVPGKGRLMFVSIALKMYNIVQRRGEEIQRIESRYQNDFVSDILAGNLSSADLIVERGKLVGLNMRNKRHVVVVAWDQDEPDPGSACKYMLDTLKRLNPEDVCAVKHNSVIVIPEPAPGPRNHLQSTVRSLQNWKSDFMVGVGSGQSGVEFLHNSYNEACNAIRIHRILSAQLGYCDKPSIIHYDNVRHLIIMEELAGNTVYRDFSGTVLGPVLKYDRNHQSKLLHTMFVHIWEGLNSARTASRLFIHRNTLNYRLERLRRVLGEDPFSGVNLAKYLLALGVRLFA